MPTAQQEAFRFGELTFTKAELLSLPKPHLEFLVGSCIATNDIVIFRRIISQLGHGRSHSEVINEILASNFSFFIRKLASSIVEYIKLLEDFGKSSRRKLKAETPALRRADDLVVNLKAASAYPIALWFRNHATHHFLAKELAANIKSFDDDQEFKAVISEMNGNSMYVLGEEIAVLGKIQLEYKATYDDFVKWTINSSANLELFQQTFLIEILMDHFPSKRIYQREVGVEPEFFAPLGSRIGVVFGPRLKG